EKLKDKKLDQKQKDKLIEQIIDAEQTQKQVEKDVGTKPDEGVRSKLGKLEQMLRDNQVTDLPHPKLARELSQDLERLAQEQLPQIEQKLAEARKELDAQLQGKDPPKSKEDDPKKGKESALEKAQKLQQGARETLEQMVKGLDPWASIQQVKSKAQELRDRQAAALKDAQKLEGKGRDAMPEDIAKAAKTQEQLAKEMDALRQKMQEVQKTRQSEGDRTGSERLKDAIKEAKQGDKGPVGDTMREAAKSLEQKNPVSGQPDPQHATAQQKQKDAV